MRKIFTKHFWFGVGESLRRRLGRPRQLRQDSEDVLTQAVEAVKPGSGVSIVSLDVWSEGPKPCKEHCWHPVVTSNKHKIAAGSTPSNHDDSVCCTCTHGRCRVNHHENSRK